MGNSLLRLNAECTNGKRRFLTGAGQHCLLDRGSDIMNCQPKDVVRNEPRGVRRFEHKRLREPMCWVLVRLRAQIEKVLFKVEQNFDRTKLI